MNTRVQKMLGNILIVLSLSGLLFIYYPLLKELFFPPIYTVEEKESLDFSVEIPSIGVFSKVIGDVDPFDQSEYIESLKDGVAHALGSKKPGENGTVYLFAHSSDVPWRITRYNTAFFKLGNTNSGDRVVVRNDGKKFVYEIFDKKEVWPDEIEYLTQDQGDILILQTCTPVGTALRRLLVFAKPI